MSLELKTVQVRLDPDAYSTLRMIADAQGKDLGEVGREFLTEILMGKGHALRLLAERLALATKCDNGR